MIIDPWFSHTHKLHWKIKPHRFWGIPPIPCNYDILDADGVVVYIGETSDAFRRMKEQRSSWDETHSVRFYNVGCSSIQERESVEIARHDELDNPRLTSSGGRRTSNGKVSGDKHWTRNGMSDEQRLSLGNNKFGHHGDTNGMYNTLPWKHPMTIKSETQMMLWSRMPDLYNLWVTNGRPNYKTFAKLDGERGNYNKMVELFNDPSKYSRILEEWNDEYTRT